MKKFIALAAFSAVATAATLSFAGLPSGTGVNASLHDMNFYTTVGSGLQGSHDGTGTPDKYNRVCVFCHTPHNAEVVDYGYTDTNYLPLWGRATYGTTSQNQAPYKWATTDNLTIDNWSDPLLGPSRLCMTCHDGSVAVDAHISNGAQAGGLTLTGSRAIGSAGSELAKTHPIGFNYVDAKIARNNPVTTGGTNVQEEIVDEGEGFATAVIPNNDYTKQHIYNTVERKGPRSIKSVLYNGTHMTCASCHEVHNKESVAQAQGPRGDYPNYFLYAQEKESLICLSCHIK